MAAGWLAPRPTRRRFLAGGGALALAAGVGARAGRAAERADVIVIGAGLAGLNAALTLQELGLTPIVLEGKDRVGGRCETAYGVESRPELGASQIGRDYARVIAACERFGLDLIPEDRDLMPFSTRWRGDWVTEEAWPASAVNLTEGEERDIRPVLMASRLMARYNALQELDDWLKPEFAYLDVPFIDILRHHGHSEEAIALAAASTTGNDLYSSSSLALMQEQNRGRWGRQHFGDQANGDDLDRPYGFVENERPGDRLALISNIAAGTQALPQAMAEALGDGGVRLGEIVMRIDMTGEGPVQVRTLSGKLFEADFVISAVPFTTLRHIAVEPHFPPLMSEAVHLMPYGQVTRAHLMIREPFWNNDGLDPSFFSDGAIKMFWAIDNHQGEGEYRGMMVMTGDAANRIDQMDEASMKRFLLEELARLRPASENLVDIVAVKAWGRDPLIGGTRHVYAPGQVTRFAHEVVKPWQRMHFAGEHTRRLEYGMEAAMATGERAAFEIFNRA